jgi:hypothetical protein
MQKHHGALEKSVTLILAFEKKGKIQANIYFYKTIGPKIIC